MTDLEYENLNIPCFKSMILNLTDACNCNCKYCFMNFNPKQITFETTKQAIDWLYRVWLKRVGLEEEELIMSNLPSITFFGGEPMLQWDSIIVPIMEYVRNIIDPKIQKIYPKGRMGLSITTNGTLLTPDRIRLLYAYQCQPLLSIDGNKETQDYNRPLRNGESSFDLITPNFQYLLKYFPGTTFRSTIIPDTVDKLYENFMFAIENGFRSYFCTPNKYETWSKEKLEILEQELLKIGLTILYYISEEDPISFSLFDATLLGLFREKTRKTTIHKCGLGTESISIGVDGTLFGCQEEASKPNSIYKIGNLDDGIDEKLHFNLLNKMSNNGTLKAEKRKCEECECKNYCTLNYCTVTNYTMTGDPNISCEMDCAWKNILHRVAHTVLVIAEQEKADYFKQYLENQIGKRG